ncbi:hypothetical protein N7462_003104 [Penicillium macrosclerotiorum]|uniref:uncharacterized protein n=1 Tax=Penicillium macrosclerotiorum TaxID=303699 RepID=UPI002546F550|nr:uncharacterized protein N7462_003104 [Penicillium macrosclerotiorum]KAJ5688712.1 hypothetical protein N7462_003104 [Penicillium macrosclerotiorum]
MAYDGYHSTPNPYQSGNMNMNTNMNMAPDSDDPQGYAPMPPYPSAYEPDRLNMPQPQMPPSASPIQNMESYSEPPPPPRPPPPPGNGNLNEAVSSAVHSANSSAYLSPDVLSQITATVIQQLKASGLDNIQGSGPHPPSRPPSQQPSQQPSWPGVSDPTPRPHSESPPGASTRSGSLPPMNPMSNSFESTQPYVNPTGYSSDTRPSHKPSPEPMHRRTPSISSQSSHKTDVTRPKPPSRDATVMEMTTLEKIWGKLFEDGKPTKRLGQFLRGIASHLIEDYPPGNTLVVTPEKMQKFYAETNVPSDPYPWQDIFDDRTSSISRLFREIKAEHHLVQLDDLKERPDIPGLTPKGFEKWATLMIQANPDREYERLQKAVLNMPISNPDDRKERFPKEIPRRLFPDFADLQLREETDEYIMKQCGVDLPSITDEERSRASRSKKPSPTNPGLSPTEPQFAASERPRQRSYERGRAPTPSAASSSAVIDDEDEPIAPAPIERERKPYSAQPGGGKVYDEAGHIRSHTNSFSTSRPTDLPGVTSSYRPYDKFDRDSLYGRSGSGPAPRSRRYSRGSRSSSRGMNEYRHSESDLLGRDPIPRYGGTSTGDLYVDSPTSILPSDDDVRRYRDQKSHRGSRAGEEEYYRGMLGGQGGGPVKYHY